MLAYKCSRPSSCAVVGFLIFVKSSSIVEASILAKLIDAFQEVCERIEAFLPH